MSRQNVNAQIAAYGDAEIARLRACCDTLEAALLHMVNDCGHCGGSGRALESVEDDTPCPRCEKGRAALVKVKP